MLLGKVRRFEGSEVRGFGGSLVRRFVGSEVRWFEVRWFVSCVKLGIV
jgi:hypothetical protein